MCVELYLVSGLIACLLIVSALVAQAIRKRTDERYVSVFWACFWTFASLIIAALVFGMAYKSKLGGD